MGFLAEHGDYLVFHRARSFPQNAAGCGIDSTAREQALTAHKEPGCCVQPRMPKGELGHLRVVLPQRRRKVLAKLMETEMPLGIPHSYAVGGSTHRNSD